MLEYVNDDSVTVKEEVKPTGDYGRVYDALAPDVDHPVRLITSKESEVLTNLEILERAFERGSNACDDNHSLNSVQTPLRLFIFLNRGSQFSPSMIPDR